MSSLLGGPLEITLTVIHYNVSSPFHIDWNRDEENTEKGDDDNDGSKNLLQTGSSRYNVGRFYPIPAHRYTVVVVYNEDDF